MKIKFRAVDVNESGGLRLGCEVLEPTKDLKLIVSIIRDCQQESGFYPILGIEERKYFGPGEAQLIICPRDASTYFASSSLGNYVVVMADDDDYECAGINKHSLDKMKMTLKKFEFVDPPIGE